MANCLRTCFIALLVAFMAASVAALGGRVAGGHSAITVDSKEVKDAAAAALAKFNERSFSLFRHQLVRIDGGTQQVVAGVLYDLQMVIVPTDCRNQAAFHHPIDDKDCKSSEHDQRPLHAKVWWQSWNTEAPYRVEFLP